MTEKIEKWKCLCLMDGAYFNDQKLRRGEIFYIQTKFGKRDPQKGLVDNTMGYKDIVLTPAQQFSHKWMKRLDTPINEEEDQEHNDEVYSGAVKSDKVIKKLAKNVVDVEDDEPIVVEEEPKPVAKKKTGKKPVGSPKEQPSREETEEVI